MAKPTIIIRRRREDSEGPTVIRLPPKPKPRVVIVERKTEPAPVVYRRSYNDRPLSTGEAVVLGLVAVGFIGLVAFSIWLAAQEQALYDDGDVIIID